MARKRKQPKMTPAISSKVKPVRLDLSEEEHHRLRVAAAKANKSMTKYAHDILMEHIDRQHLKGE